FPLNVAFSSFYVPAAPRASLHFATRRSSDLGADAVMMLLIAELKVVPVTVHVAIKEVATTLSTAAIVHCARVTAAALKRDFGIENRKSTRLNSSHVKNSYAVFCLKKKKKKYI